MSMNKLKIAIRIVLGLTLAAVVLYSFAIYSLNQGLEKTFGPEFQKDAQDLGVAVKGAAGEALFEHGTVIPSEANTPAGADAIEKSRSLLATYRNDPEKFKRYGALLETAANAFAIGDAIRQLPASATLPSDSSGVMSLRGDQRVDSWGHPYCLSTFGKLVAIISPGPEAKMPASCRSLAVSKKVVFSAPRKLFEHPSGQVVLIVDRDSPKRSVEQVMERP